MSAVEVVHEELNLLFVLFFILFPFGIVLLNSITINHDLEIARPDIDILAKYNLLTHTLHAIYLTKDRSRKQYISRLLITGLTQDRDIPHPVYTVSVDRGDNTTGGHPIGQDTEVAMVDIDTIGLDDLLELVDKGLAGGLYTQDAVDLNHVVAVGLAWVDLEVG